jgi:hypothetical protein
VRTISAAQQGVRDSGVQAEHLRISVKDAGGTFRDLTNYPGFNAVISCSISADVNDPHMTFEAELSRKLFDLNLSPLMADSALNRGFNPTASFAALIAIRREVKIEVAIVAADAQPESGDWFEVFRGHIDRYNLAAGPHITIAGRDLGGKLATTYIKKERVYAFAADSGTPVSLRIWTPEMVVVAGEYVVPATRGDGTDGTPDPGYNKFFKCATGGTTGTAEPTWTTGSGIADGSVTWDYKGAPTTSGFAVETMMQLLLDDNPGASAGTMVVDGSPSWTVGQWLEQRGPLLDAVRKLATQNGWDFRSKWHAGSSSFRLTLYEPDRASPTSVHTFARADYLELRSLEADIANVRNSIDVIYEDATVLWPDGSTIRKVVHDEDAGSIAANGELWAEIQEDELSNIDTEPEAERYAAAFISDCSQPDYALATDLTRGFPWLELNDYLTFTADDDHMSADQSMALVSVRQNWSGGHLTTSVQLRGKPTLGSKVHIERVQHPRRPPRDRPHRLTHFQGVTTPTAVIEELVGGARVNLGLTLDKGRLIEEYEHHVYETPGTTLGPATLATVTKDRSVEFAHLEPGKTYRHRLVARTQNAGKLVRSEPSVEVAFGAGRANSGHIKSGIALGDYPLNGGFETRFGAGMPDHWTIVTGTLGTQIEVIEDGSGVNGGRYVKLAPNATAATMESAVVPLGNEMPEANRYSGLYRVVAWIKNDAGNGASNFLVLSLYGYDYAGTYVDVLGAISVESNSKVGHWQKVETILKLDDTDTTNRGIRSLGFNVNFVRASGTPIAYIDEIRMQYLGSPWYEVGDTTKFTDSYESIPGFTNSWVNYDATNDTKAAFRRTCSGEIQIRGVVKSGTVGTGTPVFTLPAGFRPTKTQRRAINSNNAFGVVTITTAGEVSVSTGSNVLADFGDLRFLTF